MARTLMLVPLKVNFQHVPQLAELKPSTAAAPPMLGKLGNDLNVVKPKRGWSVVSRVHVKEWLPFVRRPFGPLEQETVVPLHASPVPTPITVIGLQVKPKRTLRSLRSTPIALRIAAPAAELA